MISPVSVLHSGLRNERSAASAATLAASVRFLHIKRDHYKPKKKEHQQLLITWLMKHALHCPVHKYQFAMPTLPSQL